jgi:hypothetical protein
MSRVTILALYLASSGIVTAEGPKSLEEPTASKKGMPYAVVVPATTPFENDPKQRDLYVGGYRQGYRWARSPEHHDAATTNPSPTNLAAIRGVVEGWQAGVKSVAPGTLLGDLPAKYARFIVWDQAAAEAFVAEADTPEGIRNRTKEQWEEIRAARIKDHNKGSATEFAGRWRMTLPAGFVYDIDLVSTADELLELKRTGGGALTGAYALSGDRLRVVRPVHNVDDLEWQYQDGKFVLVSEVLRNGAHYVGATMQRLPTP